ncbi:MAG: methyltransferase domain-containing protein [Ferruginibacter sp.]
MLESLLNILRCPVTNSRLELTVISKSMKELDGVEVEVIENGILFAEKDWFYPVINGIPRLALESVIDYEDFLQKHLPDFIVLKENLLNKYNSLLQNVLKKNKRTKESFTQEWAIFDPQKDKTWNADEAEMLQRFFIETDETKESLQHKIIFDAGCGNGLLNSLLAKNGITNIAMDFSASIENAYIKNTSSKVHFIQGDVQYPPLMKNYFDIVHSSGVLIHTTDTHFSFSCIAPLVKSGGKISVWLYHHRKNLIHNLFNSIRKRTSRLPLRLQYHLYKYTIFPVSYVIKKIKGTKQNRREMMVDILDWFTPEYRWEHSHEEVEEWFSKEDFENIKITTDGVFGFNTIGTKK